jgi:GH15 family glucan-1,4-alpha-glucosidase
LLPQLGFLPATDERIRGTVKAVEKHLLVKGLVRRYDPAGSPDGISGGEGVFIACCFWLADAYALEARMDHAREMFERVLTLRNDVGLLSAEYDADNGQQLGNFPQGLSHLALVNSAHNLTDRNKAGHHRASRSR